MGEVLFTTFVGGPLDGRRWRFEGRRPFLGEFVIPFDLAGGQYVGTATYRRVGEPTESGTAEFVPDTGRR